MNEREKAMVEKIVMIRDRLDEAVEAATNDLLAIKREMLERIMGEGSDVRAALVDGRCIIDAGYEPLSDVEFAGSCLENIAAEYEAMSDHLNDAIDHITGE